MDKREEMFENFIIELEILKEFRKIYKRNALDNFIASRGLRVIERIGGFENFKELLFLAGFSRSYVYKALKKIKKEIKEIKEFWKEYKNKTDRKKT